MQSDDVEEKVAKGSKPQKFSHGFWDAEVAPLRKVYFKIVGSLGLLTIVVMCEQISLPSRPPTSAGGEADSLLLLVVVRDHSELLLGTSSLEMFQFRTSDLLSPFHHSRELFGRRRRSLFTFAPGSSISTTTRAFLEPSSPPSTLRVLDHLLISDGK